MAVREPRRTAEDSTDSDDSNKERRPYFAEERKDSSNSGNKKRHRSQQRTVLPEMSEQSTDQILATRRGYGHIISSMSQPMSSLARQQGKYHLACLNSPQCLCMPLPLLAEESGRHVFGSHTLFNAKLKEILNWIEKWELIGQM